MGSAHSKRSKFGKANEGLKCLIEYNDNEIRSNDNDNEWGFIKKMIQGLKALIAVIKEILAKCLPMDQTNAAKNSPTSESSQPSGPKDVFLSHSGKQKSFVRQLYTDLTIQGVSCFFDQDPESLPVGENFPRRIFEAAKTCKVAVLLLSKDFLESKWPMLELSAFVKAKETTNPELQILPFFYLISSDYLKNIGGINEKWEQLKISGEERTEWHQALKKIRPIEGLLFAEGGDDMKFRDEIEQEIWRILPTPSPRYHVPVMHGEARMCRDVENFINRVQRNENGIHIAGLYEIAGHGKTTLGKAFCNFKLADFKGKVCHLEFSKGKPLQNIKLALNHLAHRPQSYVKSLTSQDQAQIELYRRVEGQRVLLVLDNVTEDSIEEVMYYLKAKWGEESCILLSARSVDVLVRHFNINAQSCMRVPPLEDDEAIAILLERAFPREPTLGAEDKGFALKCAKRCLFKGTCCDNVRGAPAFHPLALKAFGGYLFTKYGSNLSNWAAEIDGMVDRAGDGLHEVFASLGKAFDNMLPIYRTIFMLLTVYMLPNMSPHKVTEWMAINCNREISFIKKAVEDLRKKAFIGEFEPEICIHNLYVEFAQSKAKGLEKWLWWKGDGPNTRGLLAESNAGFELAKLEQCMHRNPSQIVSKDLKNLLVLQLVGMQNMSKLDLGRMDSLRSITLQNCKNLAALDGMENLPCLAWLQIRDVNPMLKLPELSSLVALKYLEIDIADSRVANQLGDLTPCLFLREIIVRCPSLSEFPRVNGLSYLEKVKFSLCDKVKGPLDCRECAELQSVVLDRCSQMVASPLLAGCNKLLEIVLRYCEAVTACPDIHVPSALKTLELSISSKAAAVPTTLEFCDGLENLHLWNMEELKELPSFNRLSNLTVLEIGNCDIREPPDLTSCLKLEDVYFSRLKNLARFPNFSLLRKLKRLRLYECTRVQDPPNISGCHELQAFHLLHNDNMEGRPIPKMDSCPLLEEIILSWRSDDKCLTAVHYRNSLLGYFKYEDLQNLSVVVVPEELKELQWLKGNLMQVKQYVLGVKLYYSIMGPCEKKFMFRVDVSWPYLTISVIKSVTAIKGVDSAYHNGDCTVTIIGAVGEVDLAFLFGELMKFGPVDPAILVDPEFLFGKTLKLGAAHLLE